MFKIVNKLIVGRQAKRLDIYAPIIARKALPGQFVSICPEAGAESIPLSIIDTDKKKGIVTLIFSERGNTTRVLGALPLKAKVCSLLGPLGAPSLIENEGLVVCVATGIGGAQILPICRGLKKAGNKVIGIMGAETKRDLMVEAQMRLACDKMLIATEDGSYERKGKATDLLMQVLAQEEVDMVYAIGAASMMEAVCYLTQEDKIKTRVQLHPVMLPCVGMCGACRVRVAGHIKLACIDGPEFDGHKIDFNEYRCRIKSYREFQPWVNCKGLSSHKTGEPKTFKKLIKGLLKK